MFIRICALWQKVQVFSENNTLYTITVLILALGVQAVMSLVFFHSEQKDVVIHEVLDGDTVTVKWKGRKERVRLLYIDAPELGQEGLLIEKKMTRVYRIGQLSKNYLKKLIGDKKISLKVRGRDQYKRLLGVLYQGKSNLNFLMVLKGMAYVYKQGGFPSIHTKEMFIEAYQHAKQSKKGIWKLERVRSPYSYRKFKKKKKVPF